MMRAASPAIATLMPFSRLVSVSCIDTFSFGIALCLRANTGATTRVQVSRRETSGITFLYDSLRKARTRYAAGREVAMKTRTKILTAALAVVVLIIGVAVATSWAPDQPVAVLAARWAPPPS